VVVLMESWIGWFVYFMHVFFSRRRESLQLAPQKKKKEILQFGNLAASTYVRGFGCCICNVKADFTPVLFRSFVLK
jgi:hypothetical protein